MSIITDGLLIATCLTAALYCIVLSRRLARFSDTKSGIGEQIAHLNAILEETRTTIKETQSGAKSVSDRLSRDLAGSKKASHDLAALIERAESALDRALELQDSGPRQTQHYTDPMPEAPAELEVPEAEPVQEVAQEAPNSPPDVTPIEEQTLDEIAERDFDLADARGEPQLGFLPNVSDTSHTDENFSSPPPETRGTADQDNAENLLKVERMAL